MCFLFLVKFAVGAEQRGHKEMIGTLCSQHGGTPGQSESLFVLHVHRTAPLMSKLKKLKTFLNTRSKNAHDLLVKTIEKTSFWKDESTLAFPLFSSFSQYC